MEERIKQLAKGMKEEGLEKAKLIQNMLLFDTGNHVPLSFITAHMD